MVNPVEHGLKHCVFSFHIEVVVLNDSSQLLHRELQQLLWDANYLLKAVQDVEEDLVPQLRAVVEVHQPPDANAIPQAQLVLQEEAAGLNNPWDQELVCSCQNLHHITLCDGNRVGVGIIDDEVHHVR